MNCKGDIKHENGPQLVGYLPNCKINTAKDVTGNLTIVGGLSCEISCKKGWIIAW